MADCFQIDPPPPAIEINLPGGAIMKSIPNPASGIITEIENVKSIMAQMAPALAAIQPLLRVVDAVASLFETIKLAPQIPNDPTGFIESLEETTVKIAKLAELYPEVSAFATVQSTLRAILKFAQALKAQLEPLVTIQSEALALIEQAVNDNDLGLKAAAECSLEQVESLMEHTGSAFGPLASVMGLITTFIDFLPTPIELPVVPDPVGLTGQQLIDALDVIIDALESIPIL